MSPRDDDVHVVGLAEETAELEELLGRARDAGPVVAVVQGPPGSGKTTLVRRFLRARPELLTTAAPGLPWESDRPGALARRLLPDGLGEQDEPVDAHAVDLGIVLARRWHARSAEQPLVVVVDDAHQADVVSLQALASATARLHAAPVLLLLTRCTGWRDPGDPHSDVVLDRLAATSVRLRGLDPMQVRLLAARVAAVDLTIPVARRLCEHTAGVPGHLLELLRDLPPVGWSDWRAPLPAPSAVQRRVHLALDRCSPPARALVEAAAVLGRRPLLADAAALAGVPDPIAALDEAWTAGLLAPAGHGLDVLVFPQPVLSSAVHAGLSPRARNELHLRAATVVTDETERLRHRVQAAPLPDARLAEELLELSQRKADEGAWAVVAEALIDASRISPRRADRDARLIEAVDALAGAGLLSRAVDALPEVEALPPGPRRDAVLGYVAVQRGRRVEALTHLQTAWRLRSDDRAAAAVVCQRFVLHALADWDGDEVVRWAGRAVEHADRRSPAAVESRAMVGLGHAARGSVREAFTAYRQAVAESPSGPQHQRARMGLGWLSLAQDDPEAARRELEFAVPTVRQAGSSRVSLWALGWLARTRFALGDWPGALDAVGQAEALLAASGLELLRPLVHWTGAQVHALRGEPDDAERHLRLGAAGEHEYTVRAVPALLARAHVAEAASDYAAVVRHLTALAVRTPRGGLDEPGFWPWHDVYANALVMTNRLDDAEAFLAPLEATARERRHRSAGARLGYVRGRLLAARGDLGAAEGAFAAARAAVADLPLPYEQARVDFAQGVTLRRAGRRRDAAALLATARRAFAALDARVYVERCDRELRTGRPAARGADAGLAALTEQERSVAALVAEGRTNSEVAAAMLLSVKTVQFHLTRAYAKLGVRSRTELAARFPLLASER